VTPGTLCKLRIATVWLAIVSAATAQLIAYGARVVERATGRARVRSKTMNGREWRTGGKEVA